MSVTTAQTLIAQLRVWFPLDKPFWAQEDSATPAAGERSLRAALGTSRTQTLANHLATLNMNLKTLSDGLQTTQPGGISGPQFWGNSNSCLHYYLYVDPRDNTVPFSAYEQRGHPELGVPNAIENGGILERSNGDGPVFHHPAANSFDGYWPGCLFPNGQFNLIDSMAQSFAFMTDWTVTHVPVAPGQADLLALLAAVERDLPLIEASTQKVSDTVDDVHKTAGRLEAEVLGGFVAAGVGAVLFGAGFTAATATLAAEIATLAAEELAAISAGMLERAAEAGIAATEAGTEGDAIASVKKLEQDITDLVDEHTKVTDGAGNEHRVHELLEQTSVLIDGQEVRLLNNLYVKNGSELVPFSDAMKGAVYQDTSGKERNAFLTLLMEKYHVDLQDI